MLQTFRTYRLAVAFHRQCRDLALPHYLQDQLVRASSSVALNLAEGSGRVTGKDQARFFHLAMGSLRECQAALDLAQKAPLKLVQDADELGAHLWRLIHPVCRK
jgi:four helix bundle protein